jgi:hypothetical protein
MYGKNASLNWIYASSNCCRVFFLSLCCIIIDFFWFRVSSSFYTLFSSKYTFRSYQESNKKNFQEFFHHCSLFCWKNTLKISIWLTKKKNKTGRNVEFSSFFFHFFSNPSQVLKSNITITFKSKIIENRQAGRVFTILYLIISVRSLKRVSLFNFFKFWMVEISV